MTDFLNISVTAQTRLVGEAIEITRYGFMAFWADGQQDAVAEKYCRSAIAKMRQTLDEIEAMLSEESDD